MRWLSEGPAQKYSPALVSLISNFQGKEKKKVRRAERRGEMSELLSCVHARQGRWLDEGTREVPFPRKCGRGMQKD